MREHHYRVSDPGGQTHSHFDKSLRQSRDKGRDKESLENVVDDSESHSLQLIDLQEFSWIHWPPMLPHVILGRLSDPLDGLNRSVDHS